jgi:hypothetical protein
MLSVASCCKDKEIPTTLNGYFYTTDPASSESGLTLYMDGQNKGALPYINTSREMPLSSKDPKISTALKFSFMSGAHFFEARKADGTVVSSARMKFYVSKHKSEGSTTSPIGGAGSSFENNQTAVIWMYQ